MSEPVINVTGGTITYYAENRKMADYENRNISLTLAFNHAEAGNIQPGTIDAIIAQAKHAVQKAHEILAADPTAPITITAAPAAAKPATDKDKLAEAKRTTKKAEPALVDQATADPLAAVGTKPATAPAASADPIAALTAPAAPPAVPAPIVEADVLTGTKPAISDKELYNAIMDKNRSHNGALTEKIRELIGKYAGEAQPANAVPVDKREAFLLEVNALA